MYIHCNCMPQQLSNQYCSTATLYAVYTITLQLLMCVLTNMLVAAATAVMWHKQAAAAVMRGANARRAARTAALAAAHSAETGALLSKGLNPHSVFRQREVDAAAVADEAKQRR
jgi:hypothetical protein